jgi:hypothetical protein
MITEYETATSRKYTAVIKLEKAADICSDLNSSKQYRGSVQSSPVVESPLQCAGIEITLEKVVRIAAGI